jgi:nucleoside-diphosphate-sugar epimerase
VRVFITGASGFIGGALAARLRAAGHEVGGMDRVADPARGVVAGDVAVPGPWQAATAGADVVVHTAADLSPRTVRPDAMWRVNVLGTKHALDAAQAAGARRFVHLSSVTVFGTRFPDGVDETHPVASFGLPYADAKIASEQHVLQAHAEGRVAVTVVRPGDVYGPGSHAWAVRPVQLMRARRFVIPDGVFSPVHVDDLTAGLAAAADAPAAAGQVITLSGGVGVPNREFFAPYAEAAGRRLVVAPWPVVRVLARVPGNEEANPRAADYLHRRGTYAIAKAGRLLGWRPQVPLAAGQQRTLAWLRERRLV